MVSAYYGGTNVSNDTPTTLYRLYDERGELLYVGISVRPFDRFKQHRGDKGWWHDVASTRLEHFPTRDEAARAELHAIQSEGPKHNVVGRVVGMSSPASSTDDMLPPQWFTTDVWGQRRSCGAMTLVWEANLSGISASHPSDDPVEIFTEWERQAREHHGRYVPIYWFVDGHGGIERAPFSRHDINQQDYLSFYEWPTDAKGALVNWLTLAIDDGCCWFIREACGWRPSQYEPFADLDLLVMAARSEIGMKSHRPRLRQDRAA